jgi:hypothetical protein
MRRGREGVILVMKWRDNNSTEASAPSSRLESIPICSMHNLADKFTAFGEMDTSNILIISSKDIKNKDIPSPPTPYS